MVIFKYVVIQLDGDYAKLKRTDLEESEEKLVARALLPEDIEEGSQLIYENFEYCLEEDR